MSRHPIRVLGVLAILAALLVPAVPAGATGSHSQSKTFSTCADTIGHQNSSGAIGSTVGNSNCYKAEVRLQFNWGGETTWGPTSWNYNAVWYYALTGSTTVKSTHQVQHYPSYAWSSTSTLY